MCAGNANCYPTYNNDFQCTCQHGEPECQLNILQNCIQSYVPNMDQYLDVIACVQGRPIDYSL